MANNGKNKYMLMWSISLMIISVFTVINAVCNIADIALPHAFYVTAGVSDMAALAVFAYASVKNYFIYKNDSEEKHSDSYKEDAK